MTPALTLLLTVMASAAMGLIISAFAKNGDRAMTFAPFVLIVQLLFSGILFKLEGAVDVISRVTVSRWAIEGLGSTADLNMHVKDGNTKTGREFIYTFCTAFMAGMGHSYDIRCGVRHTCVGAS